MKQTRVDNQKQLSRLTKKELVELYRREAKKADRQMRNLEKISETTGYKTATKWAYAKAEYYIEHMEHTKNFKEFPRFDKRLPMTLRKDTMIAYISNVLEFSSSPTATKRGIERVYAKRAATLNKNIKEVNPALKHVFTWQEMATFFNDGYADRLAFEDASEQILLKIAEIKNDPKKIHAIKDEIAKSNNKSIRAVTKTEVNEKIYEMLEKNGIKSIDDLAKRG